MSTMLKRLLERIFREGALGVRLPDGALIGVNVADARGAAVLVRIHDNATVRALLLHPALALGEAYRDGTLTFERGDLADLMALIGRNLRRRPLAMGGPFAPWIRALFASLHSANGLAQARRNAQRHYDLPLALYERFLDPDLHYSCAYFRNPRMSLEAAQAAKVRHIVAKLLAAPGQRVLDIGCGWGGLAIALGRDHSAEVLGVTLSPSQVAEARRRIRAARLTARVRIELQDYREVEPSFDRIVSVGMFEHVGRPNFSAYFKQVARLLREDGIALIHTIGRTGPPLATNAFVRKYIFPGGYIPSLSEILPAIERAGLVLGDCEVLRLHYAETLKAWRERFLAAPPPDGLDDHFRRLWEYYLASSEVGFRYGELVVFQLQLAHRLDAMPITRDYITDADDAGAEDALVWGGRVFPA